MKHFLFILIILCMISQNTTADVIDSNHVKAGKFIYVQISIIPENNYSIELGILMEDSVMSPDITNKSLFIESILSHSYYVPLIGIGTAYADVYKKIFGDYNLHKIQTFEAEFNYNTYKYSKEFHFKLQTGDDVYIRFSSITGFFYMPDNAKNYFNSTNDTYLEKISNLKCSIPICILFYDGQFIEPSCPFRWLDRRYGSGEHG